MAKIPPIIHHKELIASSRLFNVEAVDLEFSNGERRTFERLRRSARPGAVMIVPMTANHEFILIREYAVGIEQYELTFPKGMIDVGESVLEAANRELKEEIGMGAKQLDEIRWVATSPAYMGGRLAIVMAHDLYPEKLVGDEPEPLEIVYWPIADYQQLLAQPDFTGAMCVAALLLAKETLNIGR